MVEDDSSFHRALSCLLWEGTRQGRQLGPSPAQQYHPQNSLSCLSSSPLRGFIPAVPHLLPTVCSPHPTVQVLMAGDPLYGVPYMGRPVHGLGSLLSLQRQGQATGSVTFRKALIMSSMSWYCPLEFLPCLQQNALEPCVLAGCRTCLGILISFGVVCCQPGTLKCTGLQRYFDVISLAKNKRLLL